MMYKMRYILVFMVLMSIGHSNTYAQIIDLNIPMYNARVKLVDEFFARFNGVEKREDVSEKYSDRESNILMLFNLSQFKSKTDSLFLQAKSFAHIVTQKDIIVNYDDTCWYAKTKCHGHLGKDKVDFYLYLIVEQRGDNMYKWAITDAEGNIFNNSRTRKHKELYVLPNAHEQSFSILSRITNESNRYIDDYAINNYETDKLSAFLTLVRCGLLKIDYVSDVEFFFFQVPNYIFTVKHFERESMNVGWLISSLKKCDELDKAVLLSSIRHISPKAASPVETPVDITNDIVVNKTRNNGNDVYYDSQTIPSVGESVVRRFGDLIRLWCETGDRDFQKKALKECSGKNGKECGVKNELMVRFANNMNLPNDSIYSLRSFLNGLENSMVKDNLHFEISNIKTISTTEDFDIVSCNLILNGNNAIKTDDLFYVSKRDNKISLISTQTK